jgi:hypothetical protein
MCSLADVTGPGRAFMQPNLQLLYSLAFDLKMSDLNYSGLRFFLR